MFKRLREELKDDSYFVWFGIISLAGLLGFIIILYYLVDYLPLHPEILQQASSIIDKYGLVGTFVIVFISGTPIPAPSVPVIAMMIAVSTNHWFPFFLTALISSVIIAYINFWLARIFREKYVLKHISKKNLKRFQKWWSKWGVPLLLINGALPISFFDPLTLVAGLSHMHERLFIEVCVVSKTIMYLFTIALTWIIAKLWFPYLL